MITSNISKTLREEYEKVKKEGLEKGIEKGIDKGILLMKEVLKLSNEGMSIDDIAKACETTVEKVKKILE